MTPRLLSRLRRVYRCPSCGGWRIRPIPSDPNPRPHLCVAGEKIRMVRGYGTPTITEPVVGRVPATDADRIEDVEFLLAVGAHPEVIVRRVGAPSAMALVRWLTRRGRHDLAAPIERATRNKGAAS